MTAKSAASVFAVLFQSILLSPLCADSPAVHGLPRDLPLAFEANQGQTDSSVRFLARGPGFAFFLTRAVRDSR